MTDPSLLRFIVMPVVGLALGIRDGRLDAKAESQPFEYKVWPFLRATTLPFVFMTTINVVAQAASPDQDVNLLEAIGFAGLCVGVLYTLARNITNKMISAKRAALPAKPGGYGFARFILAIYCIAGVVAIVFVARGSSTVSTQFGHVMGEKHQVASEVPGRVIEILAKDNQLVKAGDPLVRIADERFQAVAQLAKGALAGAEALRDAATQRLAILQVTTEQDVRQSTADLASAEARLRQAHLAVEIAEVIDQKAEATVNVASANLALLEFQMQQIAKAFSTDPGTVPLVRKKSSETFFDSGTAALTATRAMKTGSLKGIDLARQLVVVAQQQVAMKQADLQ
ncbi:MAG: HlyD family secretion protein, partial [Aeoliella sp.]